MSTALHAHLSTAAVDCDGPIYRDWVTTLNESERADEDWGGLDFRSRLLGLYISMRSEFGVKVTVTSDGFEWHEPTDEGYASGEVRWCEDEDCDPHAASQRDVYAEQMGY